MEIVTLQIQRISSHIASAMRYQISINCEKKCRIKNGESISISVPKQRCTLSVAMVGNNAFTIHKIEKDILLFPEYCAASTINCKIITKQNMIGVITCGLLQPVGNIEILVDYSK